MADVRTVQTLLQEAEESIEDIHKDESFHEWDQSFYPEVEIIRQNIEPYQKLFSFILRWQRSESRFAFRSIHFVM